MASGQGDQVLVHHEAGVEEDHFVTRFNQAAQRQHQPSAGTTGDHHPTVVVAVLRVDSLLQGFAEGRDAR